MKIEGLPAEVISTLGTAVDQLEDWQCAITAAAAIQRLPEGSAARAEHAAKLVSVLAARARDTNGSNSTIEVRAAFDALRQQQRALRRAH